MTSEERQEFFEKVKGKRINWSRWADNVFFIPDSFDPDKQPNSIWGRLHTVISNEEVFDTVKVELVDLYIDNGFNEWSTDCGRWLFYNIPDHFGAPGIKIKGFETGCQHKNTKIIHMITSSYKECLDCGKDLGNV